MADKIIDIPKAVEAARDELSLLQQRIISNMYAAGEVASGRTIRSLHVIEDANSAALVSSQQMPFGVLETGRRAGKVPYRFSEIIYQWMRDKGVHGTPRGNATQEKADRSMAYAISRSIAMHGSSLFRRGGRRDIYSNEIPKTVSNIVRKVALKIEVKDIIPLNNIGD